MLKDHVQLRKILKGNTNRLDDDVWKIMYHEDTEYSYSQLFYVHADGTPYDPNADVPLLMAFVNVNVKSNTITLWDPHEERIRMYNHSDWEQQRKPLQPLQHWLHQIINNDINPVETTQ